jgi:chaperonin GroES
VRPSTLTAPVEADVDASKLAPLHDRLLIKRLPPNETIGSFTLPASAQEKQRCGRVVARGGGRIDERGQRVAFDVEIGALVYFNAYSGFALNIGKDEYLVLREDEIVAIVRED